MLTYDQDLYDYLYKKTLPDGRVVHYGREYLATDDRWRRQYAVLRMLESQLRRHRSARILIVGCGFSPLLTAFGGIETFGTDPSPYIQKYKHQESDVPEKILPYAIPDPRLTETLGRVDLLVSDDVLSSLEADPIIGKPRASEAERFIDGCSELAGRVVHFVTTGEPGYGHPMFSYKTLDEWRHTEPRHLWVDANTFEIARG